MGGQPDKSGSWCLLAIPGILVVLCCGLPILLTGVGLTALGTFIVGAKDWIIGGVVALKMTVVLRNRQRRGSDLSGATTKK